MKRLIVFLSRLVGIGFALFGCVFVVVGFLHEVNILFIASGAVIVILGVLLLVAKKGYLSDSAPPNQIDKLASKINTNKW